MAAVTDFADTAALISNLDLVVAVDSSVAHLSGALGKPIWLLNRATSEWRWGRNKETSPWYPTMRIYNQKKLLEWENPIGEVAAALRREFLF
jgi:ADP-heptose:LPS heptosyltransferase